MRIRTSLLVLATALAGLLVPATAARATSANCIWYDIGPTNPGLRYATCAFGAADWMEGTVWVVNQSSSSHYIRKLEVFTDLGGFSTCGINAWLAPSASRSCSVQVGMIVPPGARRAHGRPYFWAPSLGAYDWRQGPSAPALVS